MKALLWLVLAIALDGVQQVLISVCTGVATLGSGIALFLMRERHPQG